jgi:hypothetical protein
MKKTLLILLTIFLFSCQKEDNTINSNDSLLSQKAYYTMLKDINFQFEMILNESKPKDLSIEEYKTALISGKIGLSSSQQNKILNATKPLIDYSNKLAKINSLSIDDLGSKIALGGMYSPNDNLNSKFNAKSFQAYNESSIIKSNALDTKQIMRIDNSEILDCALTALGADAIFAISASGITTWGVAAMTKAFSSVAKRFLGPAGVAIAVITFGVCIHQKSLD